MRVLFVAAWYPTIDKPHFGAFILEHARAAAKHCEVDLLHPVIGTSRSNPGCDIDSEEITDNLTAFLLKINLRIHRWGRQSSKLKTYIRNFIAEREKETGGYDLIHVNVRNKHTAVFLEIAEELNLPIAYTEHWSFYHRGFAILPEAEKPKVVKEMDQWLNHPLMKAILPVSHELGDHLKRSFNAPADRITKIPNVANAVFTYREKPAPKLLFKIAMVAAWAPPKNPMLFLKALVELPAEVLSIIEIDWMGNGGQLEECKAYINEHLQGITVRFHGFVDKGFVANKLQEAHLLVHPSDAENLPTVIIESLCCGTPVLSHRINGIPELIDESNGILCQAGSVEEFAEALKRFILHEVEFDCREIAKTASEQYSYAAIGGKLFNIYTGITR